MRIGGKGRYERGRCRGALRQAPPHRARRAGSVPEVESVATDGDGQSPESASASESLHNGESPDDDRHQSAQQRREGATEAGR
jgi:hypothetical protein